MRVELRPALDWPVFGALSLEILWFFDRLSPWPQ
jgi:hypothetical protein